MQSRVSREPSLLYNSDPLLSPRMHQFPVNNEPRTIDRLQAQREHGPASLTHYNVLSPSE